MARDSEMNDAQGREADRPTEIGGTGWKAILKRTMGEIKEDNVALLAAGVAFYFWIALIPAIIAAIMIYGLVADPQQIQSQIQSLLSSLSSDAQSVISQPIRQAATAGGLSIGVAVSLAAVLWSASGGMNGLIKGIGIAYDEPDERNFAIKRGLAILLTLGGIVFLSVAVLLIGVIPAVLDSLGLGSVGQIAVNVLRWPLLAVTIMVALAVIYKVGPDRDDPKVRWVSFGAVIATILWLIGSGLFSFYVTNFGSYNKTYGALAGVIILNLWLFLTAFVVLLGAEINSEMEAQTRKDTTRGEERPMGERDAVKADHTAPSS
jgi:membrane protein